MHAAVIPNGRRMAKADLLPELGDKYLHAQQIRRCMERLGHVFAFLAFLVPGSETEADNSSNPDAVLDTQVCG